MNKKYLIIIISLTISFAFGWWLSPEKIVEVEKIVEIEKKIIEKDTETSRDKHKKTTVTEITHPDGRKEVITVIAEDTLTNKNVKNKEINETLKAEEHSKEIVKGKNKVTISVLYGIQFQNTVSPIYGASITKSILGPITVGAWGFTNKTIGVSLGLMF